MEWISVNDRLPEWATEAKRGRACFLVFNENRKLIGVAHLTNMHNDTLPKRRLWVSSEGRITLYNVTHWMPLPEPPK